MQIVVHTGAHFTDDDRLIKCLIRNQNDLARRGVAVPGPGRYRSLLQSTFTALNSAPPAADARDVLLDAILDDGQADRLILSNPHFFSPARAILRGGVYYESAGRRMAMLSELFQHDEIELFMGLRNPASFLPVAFEKSRASTVEDFTSGTDPRNLVWSELIERIQRQAPGVSITVWCNEDTPLIWGQIIREMASLDPGTKIVGGFDLLSTIMSAEGMRRFRAYLAQHKGLSEMQRRRVIAAFLDKYAIEDELEVELDLPGWDVAMIDEMTEIYDEDMFNIQRLPGINFISP